MRLVIRNGSSPMASVILASDSNVGPDSVRERIVLAERGKVRAGGATDGACLAVLATIEACLDAVLAKDVVALGQNIGIEWNRQTNRANKILRHTVGAEGNHFGHGGIYIQYL